MAPLPGKGILGEQVPLNILTGPAAPIACLVRQLSGVGLQSVQNRAAVARELEKDQKPEKQPQHRPPFEIGWPGYSPLCTPPELLARLVLGHLRVLRVRLLSI